MARALWKGSISFGLVNIPIELHTAVRDHRPKFRMLYAKGQFVILTKEDFKAAAVEKTRTIDIIDFVAAESIDDRFFETPYYLVPSKGGERAHALLREA